MLTFPTVSSFRGRVEGYTGAVVLVSASVCVAAPLGGAVIEAGEAAVPGVEVQGGEVFGQPILRRGGAPGRVDAWCNLLVLYRSLGSPHCSSVGILVGKVGEERRPQDRIALRTL